MNTNTNSFDDTENGNKNASAFYMKDSLSRANRKMAYWISQLCGWAFFAIMNIIAMASFDVFSWKKVIAYLFSLFCRGSVFTHILRNFIKKYSWADLPLKKIIPRVLLSSISIGFLLFVLYFGADILTGIIQVSKITPGTSLVWISNLSSVILLWASDLFLRPIFFREL